MPVIGQGPIQPITGNSQSYTSSGQHNFLGTVMDAVFTAHPFHLVSRFQGFGHALMPCHCRSDNLHTLVAGMVDFSQMFEQCSIQNQCVVKAWTVVFR